MLRALFYVVQHALSGRWLGLKLRVPPVILSGCQGVQHHKTLTEDIPADRARIYIERNRILLGRLISGPSGG